MAPASGYESRRYRTQARPMPAAIRWPAAVKSGVRTAARTSGASRPPTSGHRRCARAVAASTAAQAIRP
ncbi:hypothetical protein FrCorBMG51_00780 [Protofrankia coriariae]|uniref:Uncharacterized protein n=1 Tax=Protofrankia coriariae TaxID=1562887 RepID=A0ABR5F8N2_9ACTN|nr:hypothetical protein FrCorBMG51_00780 [Protofrankia coriariae]